VRLELIPRRPGTARPSPADVATGRRLPCRHRSAWLMAPCGCLDGSCRRPPPLAPTATRRFAVGGKYPPDVVLLDQRMPGLSGLETAEVILREKPNQAVILFTAFLDPAVR